MQTRKVGWDGRGSRAAKFQGWREDNGARPLLRRDRRNHGAANQPAHLYLSLFISRHLKEPSPSLASPFKGTCSPDHFRPPSPTSHHLAAKADRNCPEQGARNLYTVAESSQSVARGHDVEHCPVAVVNYNATRSHQPPSSPSPRDKYDGSAVVTTPKTTDTAAATEPCW